MTALAEAFSAKGIQAREVALKMAIAKFQNNGGEYSTALAMLNAAYGIGDGGLARLASDGLKASATVPNGEAGHRRRADEVNRIVPASPTERSAGHVSAAHGALRDVPVAAHQRNRPGHAPRGLAAIAAADETAKRTAFALIRMPDGRALGEVRWSEAPQLAQTHARVARILLAAHRYATPADPTTTLDQCVPPDHQQTIVRMMEQINAL